MYDRDYFEEGVAKGISGYTNYTWQPEFTIPLAHRLTKRLGLNEMTTVLDYGCAKGYLVKALRLLDVPAFGCDVSEYAISQVDASVKAYCKVGDMPTHGSDWIIAKDVLEHLTPEQLSAFAKTARMASDKMFIVVPLGDGKKYVIPRYEQDITHVIRQPLAWWVAALEECGWHVKSASTDMKGLKDSWAHYRDGNAAITCHR